MPDFNRISAADAKNLIDDENAAIVDMRDEQAYNMGRVPNAHRIDNSNIQQFIDAAESNTPLIVCCYHGNMSLSGAAYFAQQGFDKVYSLDGGFSGWSMLFPDQIER